MLASAQVNYRPGLPLAALALPDVLGPIADLAGTWVGGGFNLISLPDFDSSPPSDGPKALPLEAQRHAGDPPIHPDRRCSAEPRFVNGLWQHDRTTRY